MSIVPMASEAWLGNRLGLTGPLALFDGLTDSRSRRERIRAAILERGVDKVCGTRGGTPITYGEAFERLYGEPVQQTNTGRQAT